ncbi:hypothetical protein [Blastomonas sp. UPD001]|jgi:hypothetical protein|uniref:hypothetical protein n=1 Tax=Blastomonas sp. UPD001 TaxID=2217673 RepID=UPI000E341D13|nr:hypothetical protein [Blastomonas sp. UPD001]
MPDELKYHSRHSLGELEIGLRNDEQWWGALTAVEVLENYTLATMGGPRPALNSLLLLPMIADQAPPAPSGAELICKGKAYVSGSAIGVAAFRLG